MSIDNVDTLLQVLRRVELLTPEQVEQVAEQLAPLYEDPRALGQYLVEIDWLTGFQVHLLFEGLWDELRIGPYYIMDRLGEGGVSEVFKAWDALRGRIVALKVLRQHLASQSDAVRQFQQELQAVTRLNHPNVIKTFDADQLGNLHYFAMEFVEGTDLDQYVQRHGKLEIEEACDYVRQVAQGLQHSHQLGLVHRDIKPANLFLINPPSPLNSLAAAGLAPRRGPDPVVKILDWGLARLQSKPEAPVDPAGVDLGGEQGQLIGTADYIAPEQSEDASLVDIRADIYSLGCTFYFLLTGQPVFPGNSLMQKILQHQRTPPPSVRELRPEVPEEIDNLIRKMLEKQPKDRIQIPLLVAVPLRRYSPGASGSILGARTITASANGSTLKPGSTTTTRPPTPTALPMGSGRSSNLPLQTTPRSNAPRPR
jgi:serine/threonine-protein kinase